MRYVANQPAGALACGKGNLVINGVLNEAAAVVTARMGNHASTEASGALQQELSGNVQLAKQVLAIAQPQFLYTLGKPTQLQPTSWHIPFEVFVVPRT